MKYEFKHRIKNLKAILCDTDGVLLRKNEFYFADIDSGKKHILHLGDANMLRRISGTDLNIGFRCERDLPFCQEKLYSYGVSDIFTSTSDIDSVIHNFIGHYNLHLSEIGYLTANPSNVIHFLPKLLTFVPGDASQRERQLAVHAMQAKSGEGCLAELINVVLDSHKSKGNDIEEKDLTGYHPFYY